jgi:hypothetical protein
MRIPLQNVPPRLSNAIGELYKEYVRSKACSTQAATVKYLTDSGAVRIKDDTFYLPIVHRVGGIVLGTDKTHYLQIVVELLPTSQRRGHPCKFRLDVSAWFTTSGYPEVQL